jgi:hypothetical protein
MQGGGLGSRDHVSRTRVFEGTAVCRLAHRRKLTASEECAGQEVSTLTKGDIMNLMRWWCALTTHKWRRERHEGVDQLHCRRCGFVTNVEDEARQARHWDSSGFMA